jgi:hypothetical protein
MFTLTFDLTSAEGIVCHVVCEKIVEGDNAFEHCTLTQGFYGNSGGNYCDSIPTTDFIAGLLTTPVVVGQTGHSFTTLTGIPGAQCVIDLLPSSGNSQALNIDYTCSNMNSNNLKKNTLLGQALTLSLNMRNDPSLGGVILQNQMLIAENSADCGSIPDALTFSTFGISNGIISYLNSNYGAANVGTLLDLANNALGGTYVPSPGNPGLGTITAALEAINNGFDECVWTNDPGTIIAKTAPPAQSAMIGDGLSIQLSAYPNPFSNALNITVRFNESTNADIDIYNLIGSRVSRITTGNFEKDQAYTFNWEQERALPQGVYVISIRTDKGTKQARVTLVR